MKSDKQQQQRKQTNKQTTITTLGWKFLDFCHNLVLWCDIFQQN